MVLGELVFLAHIPLLRLEQESLLYADGDLWRMPLEQYDSITSRAFSGHQAKYEETAPVFYRVMVNLNLDMLQPDQGDSREAIELKMASDNGRFLHDVGLGFFANFHDLVVERLWAALILAAPAGAYPQPRLSMSAVISTGDASFVYGQRRSNLIKLQGDADQEYLFFGKAAGPPLTDEIIQRASSLLEVADKARQIDELNAALLSLLTTTSPSLSALEQHTMSVIALEALLLPEIRSGNKDTFANRVSSLLASDSEHLATLQTLASQLYKSRCAAVHGRPSFSSQDRDGIVHVNGAYAQQILAASIAKLTVMARPESWQIIPVNFQKRHREMLQWTYTLLSNRFVKIHPSLQQLIMSLRTTIVSDEWKLDKQQTSHHDILDSLRLALCNYEFPRHNS